MPPKSQIFADRISSEFHKNLDRYNTEFGVSNAVLSYSEYKDLMKSFSQADKQTTD